MHSSVSFVQNLSINMSSKPSALNIKILICFLGISLNFYHGFSFNQRDKIIHSINTNYTIVKVKSAAYKESTCIVGSSYEGTIVAYSYDGTFLWENKLSGFMNHDLWCGDITGDGIDEIITANADGHIYCLNIKGELLWQFKKNNAPMYSVCVVRQGEKAYVVAGVLIRQYIIYLQKVMC